MIHVNNILSGTAYLSRNFLFIPYVKTLFLEVGFCLHENINTH
jgi:hypothetical protein